MSEDVVHAFTFYNTSSSDVVFSFGYPIDDKGVAIYPDTLISKDTRLSSLIEKGGHMYCEFNHLEGEPAVYHFFVFDADTLNKYSWNQIRTGYKILKRYDLSIENGLKQIKYVITYPPGGAMKSVPMYPPYQ